MVPQLDGTYNVSDDSDIDSHSYLDLVSSNIIAHRMRGQKQRYEINERANTNRRLALKEDRRPNMNVKTQRQKVPDDKDIDISKVVRGNRPKDTCHCHITTYDQCNLPILCIFDVLGYFLLIFIEILIQFKNGCLLVVNHMYQYIIKMSIYLGIIFL